MKQVRVLKIVVASPGDVQAERDAIPTIVDELNKGIADERGMRLEVYRWETDAYPAFHPQGPQGQIDSCLRIEDCDLLIGIFWKRFGTPVLDAQSGTEHEIRLALESCEKMGRPQLMIYFNQAPHEPQSQAEKEQWQQVLDFKQTLSQKVLWGEYNGKDQFRDFVRQHLTKYIRGDYSGRPLDELLQAYRDHLTRRVGTVRIFGEAETKPLEKVFVELTLTEEYERPAVNAQWLGLMDAELRHRRDIFARDDEDRETGTSEKERKKEKRTLKPDELLRPRTQAVIVGAPGCGKTTLLRYLALKTLQAGKRFPVFLELKSLSEKAFAAAEDNLVELLFAKAIAVSLGFSAAEAERLKAFFLARLKAGEVTIFLDGLDEVAGAAFFNALCRSVNEFITSAYRHNDLIISTRPYALQHRFEGLQEMEIAALSSLQIEAFLQHYYGDDPSTKKLQQELQRRRELSEMARVPFLLNVIAYLYSKQGEIVGERLELYRQLVQQLVTQLDREKNVARFELKDSDGSRKRDFLKQLAYERLFVDEVEKDEERLILTSEVIAANARTFCKTLPNIDPYSLAADVKATPLLREIGADAYAFSHLTLQEYLAAVALAEQPDCEKIFCRAYFNPTLAEMEMLPMALGLVRKPDDFYAALEGLPESLNFANLRLRARGLAYARQVNPTHLSRLKDRLFDFITELKSEEMPYKDIVMNSFANASGEPLTVIVDHVTNLLTSESKYVRRCVVELLGEIGSVHPIKSLLLALKDEDTDVRRSAAETIGKIGSDYSVNALALALKDKEIHVRGAAAKALREIGSQRSIEVLLLASEHEDEAVRESAIEELKEISSKFSEDAFFSSLKDEPFEVFTAIAEEFSQLYDFDLMSKDIVVRLHAVRALGKIGSEHCHGPLLLALKNESEFIRASAVEELGKISGERCVEFLLPVLSDESSIVRVSAVETLGKIRSDRSVESLLLVLKDENYNVRERTAEALGKIGCERSVDALLLALKDENQYVRMCVAEALGEIGSERSIDALLMVLQEDNEYVRKKAVEALGTIASKQSIDALLMALKDEDKYVREKAVEALGKIGDKRSIEALLLALKDENERLRFYAAEALGKIGYKFSIDDLLLTLKDKYKWVRSSAAKALSKMSNGNLSHSLARALYYENSFARQKAAQVVGYYTTDKGLLATLQHMVANDPAEEVRTTAREAAEKYANKLRYFA